MTAIRHVMFDIDGTLLQSRGFDADCYADSIRETLGHEIDTDRARYEHVANAGIVARLLCEQAPGARHDEIHSAVKSLFAEKITARLARQPAQPVRGAGEFFTAPRRRPGVCLSIATGGEIDCIYFGDAEWERRARAAPGFDFVLVGSAIDHAQSIADFSDADRAPAYIGA